MQCSGFAEYQTRHRVNVDMADRYPFHLDVVQSTIWLHPPVTLEQSILLQIVAASLGYYSSIVHD